jgi:hypothetical protein
MAYQFNGTNQYTSSTAPMTGEPMTIAAWLFVTSSGTNRRPVTLGDRAGSDRRGFLIGTANNFSATDLGGTAGINAAFGPISQNVWFHGAGVYRTATSRTAYVNGVAGTTATGNRGTQTAPNELNIGAGYASGVIGGFFGGRVADVGIWNVELTLSEIASLARGMTCDKIRPESLVFHAPLIRNLQDTNGGRTITPINNPIVANHPRVYV